VRVLLDEDLPIRLRSHFPQGVHVETVDYRGWKGRKNGELLSAAESDFDVLVTMDDNLPDQQNIQQFDLAVVILRARSKSLADLLELMPQLEQSLNQLRPGDAVRIYPPR
jgi:predicted nuclease of predicted toxin-antitoxin system